MDLKFLSKIGILFYLTYAKSDKKIESFFKTLV